MSFTGLKTGNFTDINLDGEIRLTNDLLPGTAGQVLQSQGETLSATWANPTATAVPNPLTMGTNITLTSGNATWDGSIADTINSTDTNTQLNLTGGNGIDIANTGGLNRTITTDNDGTTINNTGGTGSQNQVLKVPNALTAGTNISFSSGTTYDGSAAITINSTDTDTQLNLTEGNGIEITNTGGLNRTIAAKPDEDTIDFDGDELAVQKVPNGLTAGTNLSYSSGSTFDGASARTINLASAPTNLDLSSSTNKILPANVFDVAGDLRMSLEMGNFLPNDDNSFFNIGVEDDLSAKIHGTIRILTSSLEVCGYFIIPRNYTATAIRIDANNSSGVAVSRTITAASIITYGGTGFTSLGTITTGSEQTLTTSMTGASDRIMLIKIFMTSTSDHLRGGYIKLTSDADDY
tara:strand:+ start:84 stop:1304 length:1221 start_codon:yes stop_codon:yes gene_type:complete